MSIPTPTSTSRPGRWISVLVIVLGAIGMVYALGSGVFRGVAAHAASSGSYTADAEGIEELRIDNSAAAFEIRFDDVDQAELDVTTSGGPSQRWVLERRGDALVVDADRRWGWLGLGIMFGDQFGEQQAVLTLPAELERAGLDLDVDTSAGSVEASGDWGTTAVDLSAGHLDLSGSAESLRVDVSAGEARLDVATPGEVRIDVSAGRVVGSLTGEQPTSILAQVSAGSIDLLIPEGEYAVSEDVSAGDSQVQVDERSGAASTIVVDVSAGDVTLRAPGR